MAGLDSDYRADVIVVGFGVAGACAAITAHDEGAPVLILEKQPSECHYSNTRMSGGGFHSPRREGDRAALKAYAKALFGGDGLPDHLPGELHGSWDELAELWATYAPQNAAFLESLDAAFRTSSIAETTFPHFPGAAQAGYAVVSGTYAARPEPTNSAVDAPAQQKRHGEALHACLLSAIRSRGIPIHYTTAATELIQRRDGAVVGVRAECADRITTYLARRAVVLTCGGYEYSAGMRRAFLGDFALEGFAFYGSPANTGDGIRIALRAGAALSNTGRIAGRIICAVPERRLGLKIGLNTPSVGKPNGIVVDNCGRRYTDETRVTRDPTRYAFHREALHFDIESLTYPRIPSWMIFDVRLMNAGPLVSTRRARYHGLDWGEDNLNALRNGWILKGSTVDELGSQIRAHADNRERMNPSTLCETVQRWNDGCRENCDWEFGRTTSPAHSVADGPFFAVPLYPGGPNTIGGLKANARRQVLSWDGRPIPRLYAAGEIASVFQFAYQSGGNLAEGVVFGRVAGSEAANQAPVSNES